MKPISSRHKMASSSGIELSSFGVGVSIATRKYVREYYKSRGVEKMQMNNPELNDMIASDFMKAERIYRFRLRSGEIGEIRKSHDFYYVAAVRGRGDIGARYDVIKIQPGFKAVKEKTREKRLKPGWGVV